MAVQQNRRLSLVVFLFFFLSEPTPNGIFCNEKSESTDISNHDDDGADEGVIVVIVEIFKVVVSIRRLCGWL